MKRSVFLFFILLLSLTGFSQKTLKGMVIDEKEKPVPNASIFLSNTSVGTRAADDGSFQLYIPSGRYDLIVSSVGYQTYTQTISSTELPEPFTIKLKTRTEELETVVIEPYEKNGWEKWGLFFTENFIGTSANALDCRIKNKEAVRFRHSKSKSQLTAVSDEPLVIENKALGFKVTIQLEGFKYDFKTRYLLYTGYAFFEEMDGSKGQVRRWKKAREDAYYGSLMHFMRSLYLNKLQDEGFEIRRLQKQKNTEKQRIKDLYASHTRRTPGGIIVAPKIDADSSDYYEKILKQEDEFNIIGKELLTGDSIAYAVDKTTAGVEFNDYLLVIYKGNAPIEYQRQNPKNTAMMSQITLINGLPIQVESSGNYYDPSDLLSSGYWSWSEKISMMLPFDYKPGK